MATVADNSYRIEGGTLLNIKTDPIKSGAVADKDLKEKINNYNYDANGNLIYVRTDDTKKDFSKTPTAKSQQPKANERKMLWDEENRLEAISDNGYVSNYWYDAGGRTQTDNFTMYVNGYMSVKNGGTYTKHIYAGSQRVVSKLGDIASFGEDPRRIAYAGADIDGISVNFKDKYVTSQKIIKQRYDSLKVPYNGLDNDDYAGGTSFCNSCRTGSSQKLSANNQRLGANENAELLQYYYHPDHLGSSSFITDIDGNVAQHVEYVPFGEVFLEEHNIILGKRLTYLTARN